MGEAPADGEVPSGEGLQDDAARMKQIAADAVDPTHLLQGENPDSLQPHDAEHGVRVYAELLRSSGACYRGSGTWRAPPRAGPA